MWFYIKPLWLDVSLSGSQNNKLTFEILFFFAWMKSWSNWIWVSKVTPDFFLRCWTGILCSHCLGKQKSHCGQDVKQHLKEWFLCSLWESQPFVQMKTEPVKSALLIRNVLNAVLYHVCSTTVYLSKPKRTQHPPQVAGILYVWVFFFESKEKSLVCILSMWYFLCPGGTIFHLIQGMKPNGLVLV